MSTDRRELLKKMALLSGSLVLPTCKTVGQGTTDSGSFLKVGPVNKKVPLRVNWKSLSATDKTAFIEAVKDLKTSELQIPASFGRGGNWLAARKLDHWAAQAEVHQWYCSHRNWNFLPWHRTYLYHFEQSLRKRIGDTFRLPYWDWTLDQNIPTELQNSEFMKALNTTRASSTIAINGAEGASKTKKWWESAFIEISKAADYDSIGGDIDSSGLMESPYHNMVHVGVGGDMGRVPMAAKDPVFWLHHCNVDRLWSLWMDQIIAAGNTRLLFPSTNVGEWLNQSFPNHFVNSTGTIDSATVKTSLFTEELGYNYDSMKKTWTLTDIPPDQAIAERSVPVETVETTAAGLRLADLPGSVLQLNFTLPQNLFDSPQLLRSLRLKVSGVPQPTDSRMTFAASLVIGGRTFILPEIGFFPGAHDSHTEGMIGLSLNQHMNTIRSVAKDNRSGQLLLSLKDNNGNSVTIRTAIPNLSSKASSYGVKWKAVFV
jgi:hypothetical protein